MSGNEVDLFSILEVDFLVSHVTFFLQNFSRPSTKYMFFVGDVAVHLWLGLAINKIYTKAKKTRV
jgi:hypothetical protein